MKVGGIRRICHCRIINPGNVGTSEVLTDLGEGAMLDGNAIPLTDLLSLIDCILSLSRSTCLKEIDVVLKISSETMLTKNGCGGNSVCPCIHWRES
jgi:hypothetical protein